MEEFHSQSETPKEEGEGDHRGSEDLSEDPSFDLLSLIKSKKLISQEDDEEFFENGTLDESLESRRSNVKGNQVLIH